MRKPRKAHIDNLVTYWRAWPAQCVQKSQVANHNLKLTFDPVTHDLIKAEVIIIKRSSIHV